MHKVKRWRFYCDHCKKSGCSSHHIAKHERGCCRNPERVCGMCRAAGIGDEQRPILELIATLEDEGLDAVSKLAQRCPACIMAAILQHRLKVPLDIDPETGESDYIDFDFKKASVAFWNDVNHARDVLEQYVY